VNDRRWDNLARYNGEVARGLVHTEEWRAKMVADQEEFDREQRYLMTLPPAPVPWWKRWAS
jgi:hypothetical protein